MDDIERLVDAFVDGGIFEQSDDGDLRPTDAFTARRKEFRNYAADLNADEFEAKIETYADGSAVDRADVDDRLLGDAMALFDSTEGIEPVACLTGAVALRRLDGTSSQDLPDGFLALNGEEIEPFIEGNRAAVVYFWRDDCTPCSAVEEHFEELLAADAIPNRVALGAVYGPACVRLIRNRFDVTVAPTVLFCSDGEIESRLVGNKGRENLRGAIERL